MLKLKREFKLAKSETGNYRLGTFPLDLPYFPASIHLSAEPIIFLVLIPTRTNNNIFKLWPSTNVTRSPLNHHSTFHLRLGFCRFGLPSPTHTCLVTCVLCSASWSLVATAYLANSKLFLGRFWSPPSLHVPVPNEAWKLQNAKNLSQRFSAFQTIFSSSSPRLPMDLKCSLRTPAVNYYFLLCCYTQQTPHTRASTSTNSSSRQRRGRETPSQNTQHMSLLGSWFPSGLPYPFHSHQRPP